MKPLILMALPALALVACAPDTAQMEASAPAGIIARPLPDIASALAAGEVTSEQLVNAYIARINAVDRAGPTLQAVLSLNPDALDQARAADARRAKKQALGPLDGIPVLLKDNIESRDPLPTTAGALALQDNVTGRDAPLVAGLRDAGVIILGKTNLSEWANFRSGNSISGWSALGGQVRNPHMLDRSPCGSSSGSAVAVAASLAAGAVGTETNGSIICPSNVNGVVGFKPSVGLVSQQFIVPISSSQDTAGPMTKTVKGAAMMLNAMATSDDKTDYVAALDANSLAGARIGVARYAQGSNADIKEHFDAALKALEAAGAVLVEIEKFQSAGKIPGAQGKMLRYEFKATINNYLADAAPSVETRDLSALIAFNQANAGLELALFDQSIFEEADKLGGLDENEYIEARNDAAQAARENGIDRLLAEHHVDILVAPSGPVAPRVDPVNGDVWPQWVGIGSMAAIAGYPHLTVPMGAVHGIPIGISFVGARNADAKVFSCGYAYEQKTNLRPEPEYLKSAEDLPEIAVPMKGVGLVDE